MTFPSFRCAPYSHESRKWSDSGADATISDKRRSVCNEELGIAYFEAEVLTQSDYYPFGMMIPDRQWSAGAEGYRYGFQGQEMDNEIKGNGNSVNYKYRMHDPRIGRFFAEDPLGGKYPYYSPYAFSGNRVIDMIEQEGLQPGYPQNFVGLSLNLEVIRFEKISLKQLNIAYGRNLSYYNTPLYDFAQTKQKAEVNLFFTFKNGTFESVTLQTQYKIHRQEGFNSIDGIISGSAGYNVKSNLLLLSAGITPKVTENSDFKSQEQFDANSITGILKSPEKSKYSMDHKISMGNNQQQDTSTDLQLEHKLRNSSITTKPINTGGGSGMGQLHFQELEVERNSDTEICPL